MKIPTLVTNDLCPVILALPSESVRRSSCHGNAYCAILGREIFFGDTLDVLGSHVVDLVELVEEIAPIAGDNMVECQLRRQPGVG